MRFVHCIGNMLLFWPAGEGTAHHALKGEVHHCSECPVGELLKNARVALLYIINTVRFPTGRVHKCLRYEVIRLLFAFAYEKESREHSAEYLVLC